MVQINALFHFICRLISVFMITATLMTATVKNTSFPFSSYLYSFESPAKTGSYSCNIAHFLKISLISALYDLLQNLFLK